MVIRIRRTEASLGAFYDGYYKAEEKAYKYARKSLTSLKEIPKGTIITKEHLTAKRPGAGIYPNEINNIIGMVANCDIDEDETITKEMLS